MYSEVMFTHYSPKVVMKSVEYIKRGGMGKCLVMCG